MAIVMGCCRRPKAGIIGDRRRTRAGGVNKLEKKKNTFSLSGGISFELDDKYTPLKVLGKGTYGVVCSCRNEETKEAVAIKKIGDALSNSLTALRTLWEIQILRQIKHENVISLKDVMVSSGGKLDFQQVYIVQDLMDCDLGLVIDSKLSGHHCRYILFQILRGVKYLHSANVIHRDLKPQNILLRKNWDLKICDFGLARTESQDSINMTEYVVTRWYRAPELLLGSDRYGKEIDIWSVGCIFAELLKGSPIFRGDDPVKQVKEIHKVLGTQKDLSFITSWRSRKFLEDLPYSQGLSFGTIFPEAEPLAIDLLKKLLVMDPSNRISAMEALEHPYFTGMYDPLTEPAAPMTVNLDFDDETEEVDMKIIRELIWKEMRRFHPEEESYNLF